MKSGIRKESRDHILRDLWLKHGCPERMTIHVRKTGETIRLINGLPVTDNAENNPLSMHISKAQKRRLRVGQPVTDNRRCKICQSEFSSTRKDAKRSVFTASPKDFRPSLSSWMGWPCIDPEVSRSNMTGQRGSGLSANSAWSSSVSSILTS